MAVTLTDASSGSTEHDSIRTDAGPIPSGERIGVLDALRGAALLGILVLNIDSFSGPSSMHDVPVGTAKPAFVGWHATLDLVFFSIKWLLFEGKMRTLFSLLYGAGIVLLTERLERKGRGEVAADIFSRRNLWLLLFGVLHGTLIWQGDILSQYAIVALLFMFPLRHVAAKRLIILGLTIGIVGGTFGVSRMMDAQEVLAADHLRDQGMAAIARGSIPSPEQKAALDAEAKEQAEAPKAIARRIERSRLPYFQTIEPRTNGYLNFVTALFRKGWILEIIGSMVLGMGLFKSGFLTGMRSTRTYVLTAICGYAISVPIVIAGVTFANANGFSTPAVIRGMFLPYALEVFAGAIANASVLVLLFRLGWLRPLMTAFANVGRTAFSCYILTSLLCQFLFEWGPWKLYGAIEYYQQMYVIATIWILILLTSALWLRYFAYGPLEWVWRSLVYWKRQPIRKSWCDR